MTVSMNSSQGIKEGRSKKSNSTRMLAAATGMSESTISDIILGFERCILVYVPPDCFGVPKRRVFIHSLVMACSAAVSAERQRYAGAATQPRCQTSTTLEATAKVQPQPARALDLNKTFKQSNKIPAPVRFSEMEGNKTDHLVAEQSRNHGHVQFQGGAAAKASTIDRRIAETSNRRPLANNKSDQLVVDEVKAERVSATPRPTFRRLKTLHDEETFVTITRENRIFVDASTGGTVAIDSGESEISNCRPLVRRPDQPIVDVAKASQKSVSLNDNDSAKPSPPCGLTDACRIGNVRDLYSDDLKRFEGIPYSLETLGDIVWHLRFVDKTAVYQALMEKAALSRAAGTPQYYSLALENIIDGMKIGCDRRIPFSLGIFKMALDAQYSRVSTSLNPEEYSEELYCYLQKVLIELRVSHEASEETRLVTRRLRDFHMEVGKKIKSKMEEGGEVNTILILCLREIWIDIQSYSKNDNVLMNCLDTVLGIKISLALISSCYEDSAWRSCVSAIRDKSSLLNKDVLVTFEAFYMQYLDGNIVDIFEGTLRVTSDESLQLRSTLASLEASQAHYAEVVEAVDAQGFGQLARTAVKTWKSTIVPVFRAKSFDHEALAELASGDLGVLLKYSETWDRFHVAFYRQSDDALKFLHFVDDQEEYIRNMLISCLVDESALIQTRFEPIAGVAQQAVRGVDSAVFSVNRDLAGLENVFKSVGEHVPAIVAVALADFFDDSLASSGNSLFGIVSRTIGRSVDDVYMLMRAGHRCKGSTLAILKRAFSDGSLKRRRPLLDLVRTFFSEARKTQTVDVLERALGFSYANVQSSLQNLSYVKSVEGYLQNMHKLQTYVGTEEAAALLGKVLDGTVQNIDKNGHFHHSEQSRSLLTQSLIDSADLRGMFEFEDSVRRMVEMYHKDLRSYSRFRHLFNAPDESFEKIPMSAVLGQWLQLSHQWRGILSRGTCEVVSCETHKPEIVGVEEWRAAMGVKIRYRTPFEVSHPPYLRLKYDLIYHETCMRYYDLYEKRRSPPSDDHQ